MIESRKQLEYSITVLAKNYSLRDRIAASTIGDPDTRDDEVDGVVSMIRKIEREVAEYLCATQAHEKATGTPPPLDKAA